jgi:hypothetical protein
MSDSAKSGFGKAVKGVLWGTFLSIFLRVISALPFVPSYIVGIFQLLEALSFVGGLLVIFAMGSWGFGYLVGWLFGMWIMSIVGLVEPSLFNLYLVVGGVFLFLKILQGFFKGSSR